MMHSLEPGPEWALSVAQSIVVSNKYRNFGPDHTSYSSHWLFLEHNV